MKRNFILIILCLGCMGILGAQNVWKPINGTGILGAAPDGSIFANSENGKLARSQDEGATWQIVLGQETGFSGFVNSSCFAVGNDGRICVFNDNQQTVVYSDDNGDTWQQTLSISPCGMPTKAGICVPTNDIFVVWAENGEISYTFDGGVTWNGWILELDEESQVSDMIVNAEGDMYVSTWSYSDGDAGIFHSTLADIQNWEFVAAEGINIVDMAFDPEGNVVACGWRTEGSVGFQHTPSFYLFDGTSLAIGDGGIVYTPHFMGLQAVLSYSTDHGEHFTEIGEHVPLVDIAPGGDNAHLFKGADNHLYFDGGGEYWKSIRDADHIREDFPYDNMRWAVYYRNLYLDWAPYIQIGIKGDTIVDGTTYHKVIKCTSFGNVIDGDCFGGIRVEADGKWYFRLFSEENVPQYLYLDMEPNTERLIYDFSLSVCDGFEYEGQYWMSVFDIDEIGINGSTRKRIWFDSNCEEGNHPYDWNWIEGIGSNYGLLYAIQAFPLDGSAYHLGEVYQDGDLIYCDPYFHDYVPMIKEGNQRQKWNVVVIGSMNYPNDYFTEIQSIRDSITLDGVDYKIVWTKSKYGISKAGAVREEDRRVYFRRYWQQSYQDEELLYDFNLTVGDTVTVNYNYGDKLIVLEESQVLVQGTMRKQLGLAMYFDDGTTGEIEEYWIEGVGSTYGFLNSGYEGWVGSFVHLLCYHENGNLVWDNEEFDDCVMNSDGAPVTFAPQGAEWYFDVFNPWGTHPEYQRFFVEGDTIIQGHQCSIIDQRFVDTGHDGGEFVYEEDNKVYWFNPTTNAFSTLYDFDAEAGESWDYEVGDCTHQVIVDSVGSVTWNGRTYRTQWVRFNEDLQYYSGKIIEGIGYEKGLFPSIYVCNGWEVFDASEIEFLRCYVNDGEILYHEGDYDCDEIYVNTFCWDGTVAEAYAGGNGTEENPYQIANAKQLALLAQQTNSGTGGDAYYQLTANINLENCSGGYNIWTSIGDADHPFTGHFDGNENYILGLYDYGFTNNKVGLFGHITSAEIKNVYLTNVILGGIEDAAGIAALAEQSVITNCHVDVAVIETKQYGGGIVSLGNNCVVERCSNNGNIKTYMESNNCIGGIGAYLIDCDINNCENNGSIEADTSSNPGNANAYLGGIVGIIRNGSIVNCVNRGTLSDHTLLGGYCGGITAHHLVYHESNIPYYIRDCHNYGSLIGFRDGGGICGLVHSMEPADVYIIDCTNHGNLTSGSKYGGCAGGIIGRIDRLAPASLNYPIVLNVANYGTINASHYVGGIFAVELLPDYPEIQMIIRNAFNTGELVLPEEDYGFAGTIVNLQHVDSIKDCYWLANDLFSGNGFESLLTQSCAFNPTESPYEWHLDSLRYGTYDLVAALNAGAEEIEDDYPELGPLHRWQQDANMTNGGFPIIAPATPVFPFIGSEWYYEIENEDGSITYQYLQHTSDTVIEDHPIHIIVKINTLYDKGRHVEKSQEYIYGHNNKIYWWNKTLGEFTVLYDFGAEEGDEWVIKVGTESLTMHVDAVEQYEYEGQTYKLLRVSDADHLFDGNIVCDIGHLTSFFPERLMSKGYRVEGIRCFWQDGELVFKLGEKDCDEVYEKYHYELEEPISSKEFIIYPNPTTSIITIQNSAFRIPHSAFRISNLLGQTLLTGQLTTENQQINVSSLPEGMYFITIGGSTTKFIKR